MTNRSSRRATACSRVGAALSLLLAAPAAPLRADGSTADLPTAAEAARPASIPVTGPPPLEPPRVEPQVAVPDDESLLSLAREDATALGPLSIGTPDAGLLVNPVQMPEGPLWTIRNPEEAFATAETIEFLRTAILDVATRFPGSPRVVIGDMSRPDGGRLNRHRSHQVGRDVDLGFYYRGGEVANFEVARQRDLDLPRTWALVRALLTETDVERIFLDRSLIRVLYAHAVESGEDRQWLDDVFGRLGQDQKGILQHVKRHKNHMHVRFYNRAAQERGRIVYPALVQEGSVPPPTITHRVRGGETLGHLARRYGTSAAAIRAANGLRGSALRAGRSYRIPIRRVPDSGPIVVPPRRLPPAALRLAGQDAGLPADAAPSDAGRDPLSGPSEKAP